MTRKPPKRADDPSHEPPTTERLVELATDITSDAIVMGPQDITDIREALCELIARRNFQRFREATNPQPKAAAV